MGCGSSQADVTENAAKVILLGAANSGKSTFFKQLQLNFGNGYTEQERRTNFKPKINEQVISNIRLLINKRQQKLRECANNPDESYWTDGLAYTNGEASEILEQELGQLAITPPVITPQMAAKIQEYWSDGGVRFAFENRAKFSITDSTDYFIQKLEEICSDEYVPNDTDLVFTRFATGGMEEASFVLNGSAMKIIDVGGQRAERRKWNLYPDDTISAAIFVTSLSAFDEILIEDGRTNVMVESFEVFSAAWNAEWAQTLNFILFLNKEDLFVAKMDKYRANGGEGFKEAWGDEFTDDPLDVEACKDFMKRKYASVVQGDPDDPKTKQVYIHVTTATDARNVQAVFNDVQNIIIDASLSKSFLD